MLTVWLRVRNIARNNLSKFQTKFGTDSLLSL